MLNLAVHPTPKKKFPYTTAYNARHIKYVYSPVDSAV
jgi:hypothetical protein